MRALPFVALSLLVAVPAAAVRIEGPLGGPFGPRLERWDALRDSLQVPGVALAVVRGDSLVLMATFGERDLERGLPVTPRTMFYIASTTKPMVATLCAQLAAEGVLDPDARVREVLPGFRLADATATDTLRVRDLLSHRAGLASRALTMGEAYTGAMTEARFHRLLARVTPRGEPYYSNLHYTLLGRALGRATGTPWKALLGQRLFAPAGMHRTTTSARRLLNDPDHAKPYALEDGRLVPAPVKSDATMHAAGGVASTVLDLARFLRVHLGDGMLDGRRLFDRDALRRMRALEVRDSSRHPIVPGQSRLGLGLGWELRRHRGVELAMHNGRFSGASALIAIAPEHGVGVVLLANRHGAGLFLIEALAAELLDAALGLEPEDVMPGLRALARRERDAPAPVAAPAMAQRLDGIAGRYHHEDWGGLELRRVDGAIRLRLGAWAMPFAWAGRDSFVADDEYPGRLERDEHGRVTSVHVAIVPGDTTRFARVP